MRARDRLPARTVGFELAPGHHIDVTIAGVELPKETEVMVVSHNQSPLDIEGDDAPPLDIMLHNLGIKLSRALQGRHPDTGDEIQ